MPEMKLSPRVGRRVIAVVRAESTMSSLLALRRAHLIARTEEVTLEVLIVRDPGAMNGSCAVSPFAGASMARLFDLVEGLRWRGGMRVPRAEIVIRTGRLVDVVRRTLHHARPSLAVVGEERAAGGRWARVVARTGHPVLVARRSRRGGLVVAATDASDPRFPTLSAASGLCGRDAALELLHNLEGSVAADPLARRDSRTGFEVRARTLRRAALGGSPSAHLVLTTRAHPSAGVIEHCERRDADLVVVGVHRRSHPEPRERTAVTLVEGLDRSVLLVPIQAARV